MSEKSRNEAEGGGYIRGGLGRDLMQSSEGEATLRKTSIKSGKTKWKGAHPDHHAFHLRQQATQTIQGLSAITFAG